MEKLLEIIQKLKTDVYAAITVIDKRNPLKKIVSEQTGSMLIEKYGSIENFFETTHKAGVKDVTILVRRKNGSTFKPDPKYLPIELSFEPKPQPMQPVAETIPGQNSQPNSWLAGGLNQADAIYKMMDHTRLVQEVEKLSAINTVLEKDNKELRERNLRNELGAEKSQQNTDLFKSLAPLLMPLVTKVVGGASSVPAPGLNQPEMSQTKQTFWTLIQASDDETLNDFLIVLQNFSNPAFVEELNTLIEKHNGGN